MNLFWETGQLFFATFRAKCRLSNKRRFIFLTRFWETLRDEGLIFRDGHVFLRESWARDIFADTFFERHPLDPARSGPKGFASPCTSQGRAGVSQKAKFDKFFDFFCSASALGPPSLRSFRKKIGIYHQNFWSISQIRVYHPTEGCLSV